MSQKRCIRPLMLMSRALTTTSNMIERAVFGRLQGLSNPALRWLLAFTIYIEQPVNRDVSLDTRVHGIANIAPLIIDAFDDTLDAFPKH